MFRCHDLVELLWRLCAVRNHEERRRHTMLLQDTKDLTGVLAWGVINRDIHPLLFRRNRKADVGTIKRQQRGKEVRNRCKRNDCQNDREGKDDKQALLHLRPTTRLRQAGPMTCDRQLMRDPGLAWSRIVRPRRHVSSLADLGCRANTQREHPHQSQQAEPSHTCGLRLSASGRKSNNCHLSPRRSSWT